MIEFWRSGKVSAFCCGVCFFCLLFNVVITHNTASILFDIFTTIITGFGMIYIK